jgi:hypothetical protein
MARHMSQRNSPPLNPRVRFAKKPSYSRPPNAEEYRYFIPFVNHVEECPTCIEGIDTRRTSICPLGLHLGKKVLTLVYQDRGELYSTFDRDINNDLVRLELDDTISDVRRIAELLEIKVMYSVRPYISPDWRDRYSQTRYDWFSP